MKLVSRFLSRRVSAPRFRNAAQAAWFAAAAFGVFARGVEYLHDRGIWLDEASLKTAIVDHSLFEKISNQQSAPIGFLLIEKGILKVFGDATWAMRLPSVLGAIAAMIGFAILARRVLPAWAAVAATAMFAFSDDLIYFASELKPYSTDVAAAVAALLIGTSLTRPELSAADVRKWIAAGAALVWFSFPVPFFLAGAGIAGLVAAWSRRDRSGARGIVFIGAGWLLAFIPFYVLSRMHLPANTILWQFWGFAFPPRPFSVGGTLAWLVLMVLDFFVYPLEIPLPFLDLRVSALPAIALAGAGFIALARTPGDRPNLALFAAPVVLALAAALGRLYPFHGRLILGVSCCFYYMIARGITVFGDVAPRYRSVAFAVAAAALLAWPGLLAAVHLFEPRYRMEVSPVGDYREATRYEDWIPGAARLIGRG